MKKTTHVSQTTSTNPNPAADHLLALQQHALLQMEEILRREPSPCPVLFASLGEDRHTYAPGLTGQSPSTKEFLTVARLICACHAADAAVVAVRTTITVHGADEADPLLPALQGREYLCLCGEALNGAWRHWLLPIERDAQGQIVGLDEEQCIEAGEPLPGMFADVLTERPGVAVRKFAADMLERYGLRSAVRPPGAMPGLPGENSFAE